MEVASIAGFRRDPVRVWEFYARRLAVLEEAEPNDAHRALARLEELGLIEAVIQNVDGLHQRAGSGTCSRCTARSGLRSASAAARRLGWTAAGAAPTAALRVRGS